jgi:hypothetical protein
MDAFEAVIAAILQRKGYWTLTSVKVDLTKDEKREIGRPSSPRWELDIVAYRPRDNELRVVECKSYLDSPGVDPMVFRGTKPAGESRYKLFCDAVLRKVVLSRLEKQLVAAGSCLPKPRVVLALAAGRIAGDEAELNATFKKKGWELMGPAEIRCELEALRDSGYENSVAAVVTKLLLRPSKPGLKTPVVDAEVG